MFKNILLCTIFLAASSLHAYATTPETGLQITKPVYQWKTEANNDKKGFSHCLVKNMFDNGTMMILAQNNQDMVRLALHFPQDKMKTSQQFDLTMQIDKRDLFPVEAVAITPQILTIAVPEALPDQMRKGQALYLRGPKDEVIFTLDGMDGAVIALRDCVAVNKAGKQSAEKDKLIEKLPDDLLDGPTEVVKVASSVPAKTVIDIKALPEKKPLPKLDKKEKIKVVEEVTEMAEVTKPTLKPKAIATKSAPKKIAKEQTKQKEETATKPVLAPLLVEPFASIFAKAELAPQSLILGRAGKIANKPLDIAWKKNILLIGYKNYAPLKTPSVQLPQLMTQYLSLLRKECGGEFVAEASSFDRLPNMVNGGGWILAETACAGKGPEKITALIFMARTKETTIYMVDGPAANGSNAIKARNALLQAILTTNVF